MDTAAASNTRPYTRVRFVVPPPGTPPPSPNQWGRRRRRRVLPRKSLHVAVVLSLATAATGALANGFRTYIGSHYTYLWPNNSGATHRDRQEHIVYGVSHGDLIFYFSEDSPIVSMEAFTKFMNVIHPVVLSSIITVGVRGDVAVSQQYTLNPFRRAIIINKLNPTTVRGRSAMQYSDEIYRLTAAGGWLGESRWLPKTRTLR